MVATGSADPEILTEEVRRRFVWARRQGRPAWLWPDVAIDDWRSAMETIRAATGAVLTGQEGGTLGGDPDAVGLAGYTSGMGPLLGLWTEQGRLRAGEPMATVLERHLAHNRARTGRMQTAAVEIVGRLAEQGVHPLVLKGAHTGAAYFPEPGVRPASDIDLLVAAAAAPAAEAVLRQCGFVFSGRRRWESSWRPPGIGREPRSLTYVHAEDPWSVDLHIALKTSVGYGAPLANFDRALPMASTRRWPVDPRAAVLDQPLLLLHLAAHAGAGWHNLTLLRQVELVLVMRRDHAAGRLCWDAFLEIGGRTNALAYAYPALALADTLAPSTVPSWVLDRCAAAAPAAVGRALRSVTPATAQRIDRMSLAEHFMWAEGWAARLRLLAGDVLPAAHWAEIRTIYEERAWRLIRGRVSQ